MYKYVGLYIWAYTSFTHTCERACAHTRARVHTRMCLTNYIFIFTSKFRKSISINIEINFIRNKII